MSLSSRKKACDNTTDAPLVKRPRKRRNKPDIETNFSERPNDPNKSCGQLPTVTTLLTSSRVPPQVTPEDPNSTVPCQMVYYHFPTGEQPQMQQYSINSDGILQTFNSDVYSSGHHPSDLSNQVSVGFCPPSFHPQDDESQQFFDILNETDILEEITLNNVDSINEEPLSPRAHSDNKEVLDVFTNLQSSINDSICDFGSSQFQKNNDSNQYALGYVQCYVNNHVDISHSSDSGGNAMGDSCELSDDFPTYLLLVNDEQLIENKDFSSGWLSNNSCSESVVSTVTTEDTSAAVSTLLGTDESHAVDCSTQIILNDATKNDDPHVTYVLDESEKQRRKGSAAEKWARRKNREELNTISANQWSEAEEQILKENVQSCASLYKSSPSEIIHNWEKGRRGDFYKIISTGLERPLNSIYRKALRLFDKPAVKKGKFCPDELELLRSLQNTHGNDWIIIGRLMNRTADSVRDKFRTFTKSTENQGSWSKDEETLLCTIVKDIYTGERLPTTRMDWSRISKRMQSRSARQCRQKWIHSLVWQVNGSVAWTTDDTLLLIEKLLASGAGREDEVDWEDLVSGWPCARSPQWLRRHWALNLRKVICKKGDEKVSFTEALVKLQTFFYECNQLFASGLDMCEEEIVQELTAAAGGAMDRNACVDMLLNKVDIASEYSEEVLEEEFVTTENIILS